MPAMSESLFWAGISARTGRRGGSTGGPAPEKSLSFCRSVIDRAADLGVVSVLF